MCQKTEEGATQVLSERSASQGWKFKAVCLETDKKQRPVASVDGTVQTLRCGEGGEKKAEKGAEVTACPKARGEETESSKVGSESGGGVHKRPQRREG